MLFSIWVAITWNIVNVYIAVWKTIVLFKYTTGTLLYFFVKKPAIFVGANLQFMWEAFWVLWYFKWVIYKIVDPEGPLGCFLNFSWWLAFCMATVTKNLLPQLISDQFDDIINAVSNTYTVTKEGVIQLIPDRTRHFLDWYFRPAHVSTYQGKSFLFHYIANSLFPYEKASALSAWDEGRNTFNIRSMSEVMLHSKLSILSREGMDKQLLDLTKKTNIVFDYLKQIFL